MRVDIYPITKILRTLSTIHMHYRVASLLRLATIEVQKSNVVSNSQLQQIADRVGRKNTNSSHFPHHLSLLSLVPEMGVSMRLP